MMKRSLPNVVCHMRPTVIFLAIVCLCICSMLITLYCVHRVNQVNPSHLTPFGNMKLNGASAKSIGHAADSRREMPLMRGAEVDSNLPKILNNIDIALHIEKRQSLQASENPFNKTDQHKATRTLQLEKSDIYNAIPPTSIIRKADVWPIHEVIVNKNQGPIMLPKVQLFNKLARTRTNWKGEKFIIYSCRPHLTCAGWGDRQHGIFAVYLLSLFTNRTFKVDMRSPCPLHKLYHPRILDWKVKASELEGLSSTHLYALNNREFRDSLKEINFNLRFPQDVVYLTTNYDYYYSLKANPHYKDHFQKKVRHRQRPILFADLWHGVFKMNKRVVLRYSSALALARPTKAHKLVCAHIRFGRNPSMPSDTGIRNNATSIKPLWDFIAKYSDPSKFRLFVASDWQEFRAKVNERYKSIAIDVEGTVIHIDKLSPNEQSAQQDACQGFEKVIADQYILSSCDILLLTYSVFGKAAAYLRRSNKDLYLMEDGTIKPLMLFDDRIRH